MTIYRVPVNLSWDGLGSPGVNVFHVDVGGVAETHEGNLQDAVNAIRSFYDFLRQSGTAPACIWRSGMVITLGEVVDLESSESATPSWSPITVGDFGADAPEALQVVVSWRTTVRARRGMGRTFLGPLNAGCVDTDGTPKPGVKTHVEAAAQGLLDASQGLGEWDLGIRGQQTAAPGATPEDRAALPKVVRPITAFKVKDRFAVLRSRRD